MAFGRSTNPAFRAMTTASARSFEATETMTAQGAANKTLLLLVFLLIPAAYSWSQFTAGANMSLYIGGGVIGGLVFALVTTFKPTWARITAPLYAAFEGLFLGAISAYFEAQYPGIASQAIALTFGTLLTMLIVYKTGLIKVTHKFRMGVVAATGGIALIYLASWILGFFNISLPLLHNASLFSIGFSLLVVGIAALNLVLDFDFIDQGEAQDAPKHMEWYAAFGLMVTLIWLYIEFLRLLSKLSSRD
jgi:uncharacterized YccA/Bax inhibitor family protein